MKFKPVVIEVIRNQIALHALKVEWSDLLPYTASPMSTLEWTLAALQSFYPTSQIFVVTIRDANGRLDAVAPLVRTKNILMYGLTSIGSNFLFEPSSLLFRNQDALHDLAAALKRLRMPLNLPRLDHSDTERDNIVDGCRGGTFVLTRNAPGRPFVRIQSGWSEYEQTINSGRRSDLRRALRKAKELGHVEFRVITPSTSNYLSYLDELVRIEMNSWKGREGTALGASPRYYQFFCRYLKSAVATSSIRFGFMSINGKCVAAVLAVQFSEALWVLKIGYDEWARKCSPGILLMHEMIRYSFEQKLARFEFLGEPENWIKLWNPDVEPTHSLKIFPLNVWGLGQFGALAARSAIGKSKRFAQDTLAGLKNPKQHQFIGVKGARAL